MRLSFWIPRGCSSVGQIVFGMRCKSRLCGWTLPIQQPFVLAGTTARELSFDGFKDGLNRCIIIAISLTRHWYLDPMLSQDFLIILRAILRFAVCACMQSGGGLRRLIAIVRAGSLDHVSLDWTLPSQQRAENTDQGWQTNTTIHHASRCNCYPSPISGWESLHGSPGKADQVRYWTCDCHRLWPCVSLIFQPVYRFHAWYVHHDDAQRQRLDLLILLSYGFGHNCQGTMQIVHRYGREPLNPCIGCCWGGGSKGRDNRVHWNSWSDTDGWSAACPCFLQWTQTSFASFYKELGGLFRMSFYSSSRRFSCGTAAS